MELKAKLWTRRCNEHCRDTAQEAFSDSCNTDYIVQRPIKGGNDESSHSGHTMHKWLQSDSGGEGRRSGGFTGTFWDTDIWESLSG